MATAADILGSNGKRKIPAKWADYYHRLCSERERLSARDLAAPTTSRVKVDDLADAASEESERSLSLVTATATQDIIFEVLEAIRRIERGTYGICEVTGQPIEAARLQAIPWARYSLQGQQELETGGHSRRVALPRLETVSGPASDEDSEGESSEEAA